MDMSLETLPDSGFYAEMDVALETLPVSENSAEMDMALETLPEWTVCIDGHGS
jgi:hypothetical protein